MLSLRWEELAATMKDKNPILAEALTLLNPFMPCEIDELGCSSIEQKATEVHKGPQLQVFLEEKVAEETQSFLQLIPPGRLFAYFIDNFIDVVWSLWFLMDIDR